MSPRDVDTVVRHFTDQWNRSPEGVWAAPGRVNLIGEHTDYNEGFVMPFALAQAVTVAAAPRPGGGWSVTSLNTGETRSFGLEDLEPGMQGWQAYVAGVVWALRGAGHEVAPADLVLTSDVPSGAGLSSSAALECAVLATLADLSGLDIEPMDRAKLARRCENDFVGAPTGLMDQAASTLCTDRHALFMDCRTLEVEQVALDLPAAGFELVVVDTRTPHALVDSEYAERRAGCQRAAEILDVPSLRDVTDLESALSRLEDPVLQRRTRHVVTENARVLAAVEVLRAGRIADLAPLLDASHASMRDDFEITVGTVDLAVEAARAGGAVGARMTGGGFGGCIIALVRTGDATPVIGAVADAFGAARYGAPSGFTALPAVGAHRVA